MDPLLLQSPFVFLIFFPYYIDFGLAEVFSNGNFKSNKFCGKLGYKSPEVIQKRQFNAIQNDIWCIGLCLFILLIGSAPFESASFEDHRFVLIMNGKIKKVLKHWNKSQFVNKEITIYWNYFLDLKK